MQNTQRYVKMSVLMATALVLSSVPAVVQAQELINTATNEIAQVSDLGKQDLLEEIYADLDSKATETQSTFILVEQEDGSVTLFTIAYPFEDYMETNLPMKEVANYENVMVALEELVGQ